MQVLISKGAEIEAQDGDQWTSLMYASEGGYLPVVEVHSHLDCAAFIFVRNVIALISFVIKKVFSLSLIIVHLELCDRCS